MSLYRKWRPQRFADLKGQDSIRDTIFYGLTHDRMSQAYLFCGPRGTGKTTTARLIAKTINCQSNTKEKPCNTCASCISITEGTNLDVLEVDAASNRGIDEIRQLRDSVRFTPTHTKYKIYIIDEAHMLTREAFNALLKTLEEPPAYALFILATTESHKIPATIASRCQRYDFRLAPPEVLADYLISIAAEEGIALSPDAAAFLARLAEGSFRDALSFLEQVKSAGLPDYTQAAIEELLGFVPEDQVQLCLAAILGGDITQAHQSVDRIVARGYDLRAFCTQLLQLSQRALEGLALGVFEGFSPSLVNILQKNGVPHLITWVELLISATDSMKQSPIARLPLDLAVAKYAVEIGKIVPPPPAVALPVPSEIIILNPAKDQPRSTIDQPFAAATPRVQETVAVPVAVTVPDLVSVEDWTKVLQTLKTDVPSLVTTLAHAKISGIEGDTAKIAVRYKMHAEKINQPRNRQKIESALGTVMQAPLKIEAHVVKDLVSADDPTDLSEIFDFED